MENKGRFILDRCLFDSIIFKNPTMLKIWIWCIGKASFEDGEAIPENRMLLNTIELKRGQFIFGRKSAEKELQIDESTIYKILKKLEKNNSISIKSNNKYSIITICNYDNYQLSNNKKEQQSNSKVTAKEQQSNSKVTHIINIINDNKINKEKSKKERFDFLNSIVGLGVSDENAQKWIEVRKEKKATNTERAFNVVKEEVAKAMILGFTADEVIEICHKREWRGFFVHYLDSYRPRFQGITVSNTDQTPKPPVAGSHSDPERIRQRELYAQFHKNQKAEANIQ